MATLPCSERFSGESILVTRSVGQSDTFVQQLREKGAQAIALPALEIQPPSTWAFLDQQLFRLTAFDWLIFTSANGVEFFMARFQAQGYSRQDWATAALKIAVVGQKTAAHLNTYGLTPDFIPPQFISDSLVEHFPDREHLSGMQILYPCLEDDRREQVISDLTQLGAKVIDVPAYRSACPTAIAPDVLNTLKQGVDVVTFASPKTARCFQQLLKTYQVELGASLEQLLASVAIASIGPLTSTTCHEIFGRVDIQPDEYSLNGLTSALITWSAAQATREP
ncbi:MAG: uroporphyrinogen-III synthase [Cyanobacteria bacterium J06638_22]